jgi:hypothetical protein
MADHAPISRPYTLSSGRAVTFVQPDLFDLASGKVDLPNSAKRDIWEMLLRYAGNAKPDEQLLADERWIRAHFYAAQLVIVPRVRLDEDDETGVIERKELNLPDLLAVYSFLRYGPPPASAQGGQFGASETIVLPVGDGESAE